MRALIILHGGADACDVVEFTADTWSKGYFVRLNVSTSGGVGWCWNRPQTMFRDKTFALRESVRMRGGHGGIFRIGSRTHVRVKSNVDAHTRESGQVFGVNQRVQVRYHIAFDIVFPCHDAPALTLLHCFENLRHIVQSHQFEPFWFEMGQLLRCIDRSLMGEGALRTQIEQLACAHSTPFLFLVFPCTLSH